MLPNFRKSVSRPEKNPAKIRLSRLIPEMYKLAQLHLSSSAADSDHVECMFSTVAVLYQVLNKQVQVYQYQYQWSKYQYKCCSA